MFNSLISDMDVKIIELFGVDAIWSRAGSVPVRCIFDRDVTRIDDFGGVTHNTFELTIARPGGATQPAIGDTFTIDGRVYTVARVDFDDGFVVRMVVTT